jgi:hypothetical protein
LTFVAAMACSPPRLRCYPGTSSGSTSTKEPHRLISPALGCTVPANPVLHLNDISETNTQQRDDSGVIDHVAFASRGFEATKQHLTGKGAPFRVNQVPNSSRWQIFLRDPNNVEIELNFEVKNEAC